MEATTTRKVPGGRMARRELHFIWLLDTSGSMRVDGKIQSLNVAIREAVPQLQSAARDNPNVDVLVRAVSFSSGARWHIAEPTPVAALRWNDVTAEGHTDMGKALQLVAEALKSPPMPERAVSPVLVLVTDGHHTDDFNAGLAALMAERWGAEAVRIAIAIGRDVSHGALRKFIGNDELQPLQANNPEALVQQIRWASRSGVESASQVIDDAQKKRLYQAQASSSTDGVAGDEW
ncbi:vWA domain-containing protein [Methylibium sp.]|uniref:vWA domain-containing protein n=1 Tax=Methylibium sp. TaxID=2067992 RepID=UPI003D0AD932